ncbi:hypothetical protein [Horticoccus sp. 23ND18S-11]|uniref:hypothetical protein n=1 Tax=Horticoccus sp. 23ND18S-11 TaxID=3391832 RepID=UPI0039C94011
MPLPLTASQCQEIVHTLNPREARARARQSASLVGWRQLDETDHHFVYRARASWRSWGELVTVKVHASVVSVESRCSWVTQVFDWGKNSLNCAAFARTFASRDSALQVK